MATKSAIESKIARIFWNDGLLDVLSGLGVLLIGIGWHFDFVVMGAVAPALLVPLWKPLRNKITEPNLGYVQFSDRQEAHNRRFLVFSIALGILVLLLGVAVYLAISGKEFNFDITRLIQGLPAVLLGGMAIMTAQITSLRRFFGFAALLVATGIAAGVFDTGPALPLIVSGLVMFLTGVVVVGKFRQSVRAQAEETDSSSDV